MAEWIGVGKAAVKPLLDIVAAYLTNQFNWGANIKGALKELEAALLPIQAELERSEEKELSLDEKPALANWIWKLRDAIEEAEDVLDDMEYQELEHQILERNAKEVRASSSRFKSKLFHFFKVHGYGSSASLFRNSCISFGKRAILLDPTLENLNAAVGTLKLVSAHLQVLTNAINESPLRVGGGNNSRTTNKRETTPEELPADEVLGRDEEKLKVLELLKELGGDEQGSDRISALTISGAGGLGKTTLAQIVFHDNTLGFEVKMWVCVSNNNDDMLDLMKKAIETATNRTPPVTTSLASLKKELEDTVKLKKCLLVLDDVWDNQSNQTSQQWGDFIKVLSNHADKGSRIIITSRTQSVAEIVLQSLPIKKKPFLLGCLQEDVSLLIFNRHAYSGADVGKRKQLEPVGKVIASKCGGLPLALKMMGGLLNANLNYRYWCSISGRNILDLGLGMANVKEVLKLSYRCLPSNLQSCFRVCSLFPQDYEFKKDELITIWIGLGCINQSNDKNTQTVEDIGQDYLDELVRRSFFVYNSRIFSLFYTIHDLLHDLARDVSKDECLRVEGSDGNKRLPKTLRHLFVDQLNPILATQISFLKRLRTLSLSYHDRRVDNSDYGELNDILKQLGSIRALFIRSEAMPDLIVTEQLKHLRLFHMEVSIFNKPLKPLYKLYRLQNLSCKERSITQSDVQPIECGGISNLVRLRHLVLPPRIFHQITGLRHLIELRAVNLVLRNGNAFKLSDLRNLNKLRHLAIYNMREITSFEELKETILIEKEQLEKLELRWIEWDPAHHEEVYNILQPRKNSNIKHIKIYYYSGLRAPMWMVYSYLPYVTSLQLINCKNLEHLPLIGQLQSLKSLQLSKIDGVRKFGAEFFGSDDDLKGFPSLEILAIWEMEYWEEWIEFENESWSPCLEDLHIWNCPRLNALPALPLSLKKLSVENVGLTSLPTWQQDLCRCEGSPSLEYLRISGCKELVYVQRFPRKCAFLKKNELENFANIRTLFDMMMTNCKMLPSLVSLKIVSCPLLKSLPDEMPSSLRRLVLWNCTMLAILPNKMPSSLESLQLRECPLLKSLQRRCLPHWRRCRLDHVHC